MTAANRVGLTREDRAWLTGLLSEIVENVYTPHVRDEIGGHVERVLLDVAPGLVKQLVRQEMATYRVLPSINIGRWRVVVTRRRSK